MEFPLLELPNELIIRVIELLDTRATVNRLACTSKRIQELAEPILYRHILVKNSHRVKALETAFKTRPKRANAVQALRFPAHATMETSMARVQQLLVKVNNLRSLMFESPMVNGVNFESEEVWNWMTEKLIEPFQQAVLSDGPSPRPLQKLTSLTLHLNGPMSPYWTLNERNVCIFQHPTLEKIHVSCMNLVETNVIATGRPFSTPLKHLILEECNVVVSALAELLKLPKALETLSLGENCHNYYQFHTAAIHSQANMIFYTSPEQSVAALRQQSHSLKSITYATSEDYMASLQGLQMVGRKRKAAFEDSGFADFLALEKVHLIGSSTNFANAVVNGASPPNLQELVAECSVWFRSDWNLMERAEEETADGLIQRTPFLNVSSPNISKSLNALTLIYSEMPGGPNWMAPSARSNLEKHAKIIKEKFRLDLVVKNKSRGHYYPPYLYGEPFPKEELLYDGSTERFSEMFEKWEASGRSSTGVRFLEDDSDYVPDDSDDDEGGVWPVV